MPSRFWIHYVNKSGRPSSGQRTGKGQSSFQFLRSIVPKNVLTIRQSHSSPMLGRSLTYANQELPDVQARFRKGTRNQIVNIRWIIEKEREFQKNKISVSSTTLTLLTVWIMTNCGKLREMEIPDHLTSLLSNLYASQEATVRALYGTSDRFKMEKGIQQDCLLSPVWLTYILITSWDKPG